MEATAIFGTIFATLSFYGVWRWWRVSTIAKWTRTKATITKLDVEASKGRMNGVPYVSYVSLVEYRYQVDATAYLSTRFSVHNLLVGNSRDELKTLLGGASLGDTINAF
jgi:hypothetical protein